MTHGGWLRLLASYATIWLFFLEIWSSVSDYVRYDFQWSWTFVGIEINEEKEKLDGVFE